MSSMKLIRPPRDNKIRHFPRTVSDNNILHFHNGNQMRFSPKKLFMATSENISQTTLNHREDFDELRINSVRNDNGGRIFNAHIKSSDDSIGVGGLTHVQPSVKNTQTAIFENELCSNKTKNLNQAKTRNPNPNENPLPSRKMLNVDENNENNLFDVKDDEIEKLPEVDFPKCRNFKKSKIVNTITSMNINNENSLSDVKDEELGPLPNIGTPKRFQSIFQTRVDTPDKATIKKRLSRLKRSISSIESDEDYTSFFGAIKDKDKPKQNDDVDEEGYNEPFYLNNYVSLLTWKPEGGGSNLNRAYSAESFMKKKDDGDAAIAHPSRRSSSMQGEVIKEHQNQTDRLHMRRGALAEPEKMLMSQEIRERTQKNVEKRKTFLRKVSQFFNLRLHLNREEDLI